MNTAARMESNGVPNGIHLSEETAKLLVESGKQAWVKQREDRIIAKGKGELTTFWLDLGCMSKTVSQSSGVSGDVVSIHDGSTHNNRKMSAVPTATMADIAEASNTMSTLSTEQALPPYLKCSPEKTERLI